MLYEKFPPKPTDEVNEHKEDNKITNPERLSPEKITEKVLEELLYVDKVAFEGIRIELSKEEAMQILENPGAIHLVIKNDKQEIVGYLTSLPHNESYTFKSHVDSDMKEEENCLYIESMAVLPKYRSYKGFTSLLKKLIEESRVCGYKYLSMHARVNNGITDVLQKKYKARFEHRVDNFYGTTESFDYLKLDLSVD